MDTQQNTVTHDGQTVYAPGTPLPEWAHGWTQCDNRGGGYAVWLETDEDRARSGHDIERLHKEAAAMRTKAQAEAALRELGLEECQIGGRLKDMRLTYVITSHRDLWPLRQIQG